MINQTMRTRYVLFIFLPISKRKQEKICWQLGTQRLRKVLKLTVDYFSSTYFSVRLLCRHKNELLRAEKHSIPHFFQPSTYVICKLFVTKLRVGFWKKWFIKMSLTFLLGSCLLSSSRLAKKWSLRWARS